MFLVLLAGLSLAGCQQDSAGNVVVPSPSGNPPAPLPDSVFSSYFVNDFTPFEAAAQALRNTDPKYLVQKFSWSLGNKTYNSYSLDNANVEYAHAAGLTGAGQTISIVDGGFLQTHQEFTGKTISTPGGANNPAIDDHGTSVASVAAGSASAGQMIGVAPGADLQLGSFATYSSMIAATQQATSLGAIAQNNSWGYEVNATASQYNSMFGSGQGANYINALRTFGQNGVIVFAASNKIGRTHADLMSSLPMFATDLEKSFIAVVNAVPKFSGGNMTGASRVSSACLEAARWCMAADGNVFAATATSNTSYATGSGTSFAAPQVAGALALLAEAFPGLSAQALRARLLASANNTFYKHTGYVDFGTNVRHGYNTEFGHGFLDLKAALMPIGGAYVPVSNGTLLNVSGPIVLGSALSGDAVAKRLSRRDIMVVDGLGAGFDTSGSAIAATAQPATAALQLSNLMGADLSAPEADPFNPLPKFVSTASGQQVSGKFGAFDMTVLASNGGAGDFGLALSRRIETSGGQFTFGLSAMHEANSFAGMGTTAPGANLAADHAEALLELGIDLAPGRQLSVAGTFGVARPDGALPLASLSPASYNSLRLSYGARDAAMHGDRLAIGLSLPQAMASGSARFSLPVAMSAGGPTFREMRVPLAPSARQADLSVSYGRPLADGAEIVMSATRSLNAGNIAGRGDTNLALGYRFSF